LHCNKEAAFVQGSRLGFNVQGSRMGKNQMQNSNSKPRSFNNSTIKPSFAKPARRRRGYGGQAITRLNESIITNQLLTCTATVYFKYGYTTRKGKALPSLVSLIC
jgi:hypothetical protein